MSSDKFDPSMIKSIPPELLKKIPGELPPPGVQPNFVDPPTRVPVILGVGSAFLLLALLCYTVRVYTKTFIARHLKWDDRKCMAQVSPHI